MAQIPPDSSAARHVYLPNLLSLCPECHVHEYVPLWPHYNDFLLTSLPQGSYVANGSELAFAQPLTPESAKKSSTKSKSKSKSKSPAAFDEAGNEIKRPLNKFMLYRQEMGPKFVADTKITDHRQISRMVAAAWKALGVAGQQPWADQADAAQRRHQQMYPDYKFQPKPKVERQKRKTYGNTKEHLAYIAQLGARAAANEDLSEVAQAYAMVKDEPRAKRRSRKATTDSGPAANVPSGSTTRKARAAVRAASEESYSSVSTGSSTLSSLPSDMASPPPSLQSSYFAEPYVSPSAPWTTVSTNSTFSLLLSSGTYLFFTGKPPAWIYDTSWESLELPTRP